MIIAKSEKRGRIFTGLEIRHHIQENGYELSKESLKCPICGKELIFNNRSIGDRFDYFTHADGTTDCFETAATSDEHRVMIEATVKLLHNRISEVTDEPVEIDAERWIGIRENFIITDVRVTTPVRIAAELFYKTDMLGLGRRLGTMFSNNYRTYLIFHTDGRHDIDTVEHHLQKVAPIQVGRFYPETLELTLGDLFRKDQFKLTKSLRKKLPDYIAV